MPGISEKKEHFQLIQKVDEVATHAKSSWKVKVKVKNSEQFQIVLRIKLVRFSPIKRHWPPFLPPSGSGSRTRRRLGSRSSPASGESVRDTQALFR